MPTPLEMVLASPVWEYHARRFSFPVYDEIRPSGKDIPQGSPIPKACRVFEEMKLPIRELERVFGRTNQGYQGLGDCPIDNYDRWAILANICGKVIRLYWRKGGYNAENASELVGTFYPNQPYDLAK
jgi:hypothetical protein